MAGLTDDQLKALVDQELRTSIGYGVGKLASQRQKALYYYEGLPKGDLSPPEIEGRSTVVATEVRNVIQSVLPVLMSKFASGEDIVQAEALKPQFEQGSKQVTDYMNHVFYNLNDGHRILETAFLDTLISKVGILKCYWDTRTEETKEEYKGLSDIELAQLLEDEEVEATAHDSYPDEDDEEQRQQALAQMQAQLDQAMQAAQMGDQQAAQAVEQLQNQLMQASQAPVKMLHDVEVKRVKSGGRIRIENVPPEEFRISRKAKSLHDAPMVGHSVRRTVSELKSMGYKNVDAISSDMSSQNYSMEAVERQSYDDEQPYLQDDTVNGVDPSMRVIWLHEVYVRADRDGDGIAELLKITKAGNELLDVEVVDVVPFIDFRAIVLPHRFFGMSLADLAMEPQRIKTNILRAIIDNLMLQVNGRYFAVEGQTNLDDLLTSRPGGVVRIKSPGAVGRLDQAAADMGDAMSMMQYLQGFTEEATGWQRTANAQDNPDSLNTTATAANIQQNRAEMRVDLMARNLAEGVVGLFRLMLKLICQNQDKVEQVRINGQWADIDPREWKNGYDFKINVGLGTGSKDQQVRNLTMLMQHQGASLGMGIATPATIYQSAKKLTEALGFKNSDSFWVDPQQNPMPQQPNPDMLKLQQQAQMDQAKIQMELQKIEAEKQAKIIEQQAQLEDRQKQLELEAQRDQLKAQQQLQLEQQKAMIQTELERQRLEFEKWKAMLEAETKVLIAQISAKTKLDSQQMAAAEAFEVEETNELG